MIPPVPEIDGASIVILGSFNPGIFHPIWFKVNNLIRSQEADNADLKVVVPDVAEFSVDWFSMNVLRDRFQIRTTDSAHFGPIKDLVLGAFHILEHTPVKQIGMNRDMHFNMESEENWHALGHLLAPKEHWRDIMNQTGLTSITMEDPRSEPKGHVRVKVEPSQRIHPGVYFNVNNHYVIEEDGIKKMLEILQERWEDDMSAAFSMAAHLLGLVL
jgi:hypothetical protein